MHRSHLCAIAALTLAAGAHADMVGAVMLTDSGWNSTASSVIGQSVTVTRLYAAFDESDDILLNVDMGEDLFRTAGSETLYQSAAGGDTVQPTNPGGGAVTNPENEWDSYVGVRDTAPPHLSFTAPDFSFESDGVDGGWYGLPIGGHPGLASDGIYDSSAGVYLVFLGQFTVLGSHTENTSLPLTFTDDIETQLFTGDYDTFYWMESTSNTTVQQFTQSGSIPAPGAVALFGLAGLGATRRRR